MKVVFDTNVLIAAFATRGICDSLLEVCLRSHQIFVSDYILHELERNLALKFKMPADRVAQNVRLIKQHTTLVEPNDVDASECRDATDLPILGTAAAAEADCLVTGDKDLLQLRTFQNVPI